MDSGIYLSILLGGTQGRKQRTKHAVQHLVGAHVRAHIGDRQCGRSLFRKQDGDGEPVAIRALAHEGRTLASGNRGMHSPIETHRTASLDPLHQAIRGWRQQFSLSLLPAS